MILQNVKNDKHMNPKTDSTASDLLISPVIKFKRFRGVACELAPVILEMPCWSNTTPQHPL